MIPFIFPHISPDPIIWTSHTPPNMSNSATQKAEGHAKKMNGSVEVPIEAQIDSPISATPSNAVTLMDAASDLVDKVASPSISEKRASYVESRFEQVRKQRQTCQAVLSQIDEEIKKSQVHALQANVRLRTEAARNSESKKALERKQQEVKTALGAYHRAQIDLDEQKRFDEKIRGCVAKEQGNVDKARCETRRLRDKRKALKRTIDDLEDDRSKIQRQADLLVPSAQTTSSLTKRLRSNKQFRTNLAKVTEGKATPTMERDIKSELFDILLGLPKGEFHGVVQDLLAQSQNSVSSPGNASSDKVATSNKDHKGSKPSAKAVASAIKNKPKDKGNAPVEGVADTVTSTTGNRNNRTSPGSATEAKSVEQGDSAKGRPVESTPIASSPNSEGLSTAAKSSMLNIPKAQPIQFSAYGK